jgi:glucose-like phosphotransferase system IIB component
MSTTQIITYAIIAVVLVIILLVMLKLNKKDFNMEVNKLVKCLGGKENILDKEVNMSRFKVTLKDVTKVDKEGIQKLGAKGIVEVDNQIKIIFGNDSRALKRYAEEIKK